MGQPFGIDSPILRSDAQTVLDQQPQLMVYCHMAKSRKSQKAADDYIDNPAEMVDDQDRDEFNDLINNKITYKRMEDEAKLALAYVNPRLSELMIKYGIEKIRIGAHRMYVLRSESVTISQDMLLKAGVPAETIEACKARKPYITVTAVLDNG